MRLFASVTSCLLVLGGCAQMSVDVRVLDRKFWASPAQLSNAISEQVANMMRKRGSGEFAAARESIKTQARAALSQLAIAGKVDPADVPALAAPLSRFVDDAFTRADSHFQEAFVKLGEASAATKAADRLPILFAAQKALDEGYASIRGVQDQVSADLRKKIEDLRLTDNASAVKAVKQADAKVQQEIAGLIGNRGVLDDPLASAVVYAPESYWQRPETPYGINNTFASGYFGNTDIAVKMETIGDFTIKGVRLDAAKITQATFAVARQSIKTVAALYGIPMPAGATPAASGTTTPFAETPVGIESPDQRRAAAEEGVTLQRLARATVLETILIQRRALTDSATDIAANAARATALKTVQEIFAANRGELEGSTGSSNK